MRYYNLTVLREKIKEAQNLVMIKVFFAKKRLIRHKKRFLQHQLRGFQNIQVYALI